MILYVSSPGIQREHADRLSILYFDDGHSCLDIFKQMFGKDYVVSSALTLGEAHRAMGRARFDTVSGDYRMPEVSGWDFLHEVAAARPDSYRVMLTGHWAAARSPNCAAGFIHLFLEKPWSEEGIRERWGWRVFTSVPRIPERRED